MQYQATQLNDVSKAQLISPDSDELKLMLAKHFNKTWTELKNDGWKISEYRAIRREPDLQIC